MTWVEPRYVEPGMRVVARFLGSTGVWCVVAAAAGYHARIVNEKRGIDRWEHIGDLRVEAGTK